MTPSGGGRAKYLLHTVSVGSGVNEEFDTVRKAVYSALAAADAQSLSIITTPALGTGIIGSLTDLQSAKAIFSAIYEFSKQNRNIKQVLLVIYGSYNTVTEAQNVIEEESYKDVENEIGQRDFSLSRWIVEMENDSNKNCNFFNMKS